MALSPEKLDAVKRYMRVYDDEDDELISSLYAAAVMYLENGGRREPAEGSELYNLAVWGLTNHYYDHRDSVGNESAFPLGLRPIINQLKMTAISQKE